MPRGLRAACRTLWSSALDDSLAGGAPAGVLHHAEALRGVSETFDHHTAGDATEDHFTAKPAGRVDDVAALVLLASVGGVQAQPRQLRPSGASQVAALARGVHPLHARSAGLTLQPCCCSVTSPARASVGVRLGADRTPSAMTAGVAASPAGVLNKSRPRAAPRGLRGARWSGPFVGPDGDPGGASPPSWTVLDSMHICSSVRMQRTQPRYRASAQRLVRLA